MGSFIGRKRAAALVAGCVVAIGAAVVVVPALADDASVTATAAVADFDATSAVRLHLGGDNNRYFSYPEGSPGNQQQDLRANGCKLTSSDTIVVPTATSGTALKPVGLVGNGIGVKGSSTSTGTPCGQIDSAETLSLTTGPELGSRKFTGVRLDLEMTGNAVATLTLTNGTTSKSFRLQTGRGTQAADTTVPYTVTSGPTDPVMGCAAENSSGPNSGPNDNCLWTVDPGFEFNTIKLTTVPGTVSVEGSGDFGNNPAFDSLFYLSAGNGVPTVIDHEFEVNGKDQTLTGNVLVGAVDPDGDPLTAAVVTPPTSGTLKFFPEVGDVAGDFTYVPADVNEITTVTFTYKASDGTDPSNLGTVTITVHPVICREETVSTDAPGAINGTYTRLNDDFVCKRYTLEVQQDTILFRPEGAADVEYRGVVTFGPEVTPANTDSLRLRYDPTGGTAFKAMKWCDTPTFTDEIVFWGGPRRGPGCIPLVRGRGHRVVARGRGLVHRVGLHPGGGGRREDRVLAALRLG